MQLTQVQIQDHREAEDTNIRNSCFIFLVFGVLLFDIFVFGEVGLHILVFQGSAAWGGGVQKWRWGEFPRRREEDLKGEVLRRSFKKEEFARRSEEVGEFARRGKSGDGVDIVRFSNWIELTRVGVKGGYKEVVLKFSTHSEKSGDGFDKVRFFNWLELEARGGCEILNRQVKSEKWGWGRGSKIPTLGPERLQAA